MRIIQTRTFEFLFSKEDDVVIDHGPIRVTLDKMRIWPVVELNGADRLTRLKVTFFGHYNDPLDGNARKDVVTNDYADELKLKDDDPINEFLGRLDFIRIDDLSIDAFMAEKSPVG
jgi:hypothetical protein